MLHSLDTRFGDPITALYIDDTIAVTGSALGRIVYYIISAKKELEITSKSKELIRAVSALAD